MRYAKHYSKKETPQTQPIPGREEDMIKNSAGGFSFKVSEWDKLERFLILGTEGGSYYASERKLTVENAKSVEALIKQDPVRVVKTIVEISDAGRAPKNDAALFALALCAASDNPVARAEALQVLPKVARIGTHLFQFVDAVNGLRGWGRALKRAVADWYQKKTPDQLGHQLVKYQQRNGWSHRDVLRLCKPTPGDPEHKALYRWATKGEIIAGAPRLIHGFEAAKIATTPREIVTLIQEHNLTREMIPTEFLTEASVWEALLEKMPLQAMVRNLGNMSKCGLLKDNSEAARRVVSALSDPDSTRKSRLHPVAILAANRVYGAGRGMKGSGSWNPVQTVVDALEEAFYTSFQNVPKTGKRWGLFLDVSGSMGHPCSGIPMLSCREASVAMAMVAVRSEQEFCVKGFTSSGGWYYGTKSNQYNHGTCITDMKIGKRTSLEEALRITGAIPFGGTDCAAPMMWALETQTPVDVFVVYTDSETWAGSIQPAQALKKYRDAMGIPAKLIVVGMVSNGFSIADPEDAGMLDVVGFDTAAPAVMSSFVGGAPVEVYDSEG